LLMSITGDDLQIDFLELSCDPSLWTKSTILDGKVLKILMM
jgi:hypothetical protein